MKRLSLILISMLLFSCAFGTSVEPEAKEVTWVVEDSGPTWMKVTVENKTDNHISHVILKTNGGNIRFFDPVMPPDTEKTRSIGGLRQISKAYDVTGVIYRVVTVMEN